MRGFSFALKLPNPAPWFQCGSIFSATCEYPLSDTAIIYARLDTEHGGAISYAVTLVAEEDGELRTVRVYDCDDRRMATRVDSTPASEASGLAFERFRDAMEGRAGGYPRGAIFVPSDAPYTRKTLLRAIREGKPVVLVFPDGQERVVHGETPLGGGWFADMRDRLGSLRGLLH